MKSAAVVLCFIGVRSPAVSDERVAMRVSQGGHDVPPDKLKDRFPRTMANLRTAARGPERDDRARHRRKQEQGEQKLNPLAEKLKGIKAGG